MTTDEDLPEEVKRVREGERLLAERTRLLAERARWSQRRTRQAAALGRVLQRDFADEIAQHQRALDLAAAKNRRNGGGQDD